MNVGRGSDASDLTIDWMLTHEMVHLAFPRVAVEHHWIEEGVATYVEPIARAQAGQLSVKLVWRDLVVGLPQGLPRNGDLGLDHTPTWGRIYWGGALFCLLADIEIRKRTANRLGLQHALRGILQDGGNIQSIWPLTRRARAGRRGGRRAGAHGALRTDARDSGGRRSRHALARARCERGRRRSDLRRAGARSLRFGARSRRRQPAANGPGRRSA